MNTTCIANRKRFFGIILLSLLLVIYAAFVLKKYTAIYSNKNVLGPNLTLDHIEYDAGVIHGSQTTTIWHTFNISNNGTESLVVSDIRTCCGCSVINKPEGS